MDLSRGVAIHITVDILPSFAIFVIGAKKYQDAPKQPDIYDISDQVILVLKNIVCLKPRQKMLLKL